MLKAPRVITSSFAAYFGSIRQYIVMTIAYIFSSMLVVGALLGVWLIMFILLLLLGVVKTIGIYILAPVGIVLFGLAAYLLLAFAGGFFEICCSLLGKRGVSVTYLLEYSLRRGAVFLRAGVIFFAPVVIVGAILGALNLYINNSLLLLASGLLFAAVSLIVSLLFLFLVPAVVVDNTGAMAGAGRSIKTIVFNLVDFVILILFLGVFSLILIVIPVIGWIAAPIFGLPVMVNSLLLFYKGLRRV